MGIKSTTTLTRRAALELYHDLCAKLYGSAMAFTNDKLADALDRLRETECALEGRTCFENFVVIDERSPESAQ